MAPKRITPLPPAPSPPPRSPPPPSAPPPLQAISPSSGSGSPRRASSRTKTRQKQMMMLNDDEDDMLDVLAKSPRSPCSPQNVEQAIVECDEQAPAVDEAPD